MNRMILTALLALPLAAAAHAQESVLHGAARADVIDGRVGGKLVFTATGTASDVMVIRLGDGSVYAAGTMAQWKAGVARGLNAETVAAEDPNAFRAARAEKPKKPLAAKPLAGKPAILAPIDLIKQNTAFKSAPASGKVDVGTAELEKPMKPIAQVDAKQQDAIAFNVIHGGNDVVNDVPNATDTDPDLGGGDVWNEDVQIINLQITIPGASAALGRGSVTVYRGSSIRDLDRINLR